MGGFRFLDHTADVLIEAWGETLEEAFGWAAHGMFEVMTDTAKVEPRETREVHVRAEDLYALLYMWLEELLFIFNTELLLFSKFNVKRIRKVGKEYELEAEVTGERFDEKKHTRGTEVKAVTYAQMEIKKEKDRYVIRFVLDI
ncbi:MAG: archease [Candidatus Baldrarchaeia archaeon]